MQSARLSGSHRRADDDDSNRVPTRNYSRCSNELDSVVRSSVVVLGTRRSSSRLVAPPPGIANGTDARLRAQVLAWTGPSPDERSPRDAHQYVSHTPAVYALPPKKSSDRDKARLKAGRTLTGLAGAKNDSPFTLLRFAAAGATGARRTGQ